MYYLENLLPLLLPILCLKYAGDIFAGLGNDL